MPALTVQNAEIKTATVEVKTLTISGKQVTLAVFRQLREADLIQDDGTFAGLPWGTVNYHPDKCADASEHLHVVWQQGAELRRSLVRRPSWWAKTNAFFADAGDTFIQRWYCQADHALPQWTRRERDGEGGYAVYYNIDGIQCVANEPSYHQAKCPDMDIDSAALREQLLREVAEEGAHRDELKRRWAELSDLPQLFIAV